MVERLAIDGLGARGDGIASSEAGAIYVPYTLPGEIVEVDPWPGHPDRRNLLRVEAASAARIVPICPHFGVCGGCALQHWDTAPYLAWKREIVARQLRHAGIAPGIGDILDAHGDGRRRCVLHARRATHDILVVGYAAL